MKKISVILSFIWLFPILLHGQDIQFNAGVSAVETGVGQPITYSLSISPNVNNLPAPSLPSLPDFKVQNAGQSSTMQLINGQVSTSVTYNYALIPVKEGTFIIGASQLTYNGKVYQTQPITIKVTKAAPVQSQPPQQPSMEERFFRQAQAGELFVKAIVSKNNVYINEPLVLTYKIYYRNIGITGNIRAAKLPDLSGFWNEDLPPDRDRSEETVNGKRYFTYNIMRKILFPTSPGKKYLEGAQLIFVVEDMFSFFPKEVKRNADSLSIDVNTLPEKNKPEDFSGSIGDYTINSILSSKNIVQNEPFVLKVIIAGEGNIKSIGSLTEPKFENFNIYNKHTSININKTINSITGDKTFEYILIPMTAGKLEIPSFSFSYFNFNKRKYETLKTKSISFKVTPGKGGPKKMIPNTIQGSDITLIGQDIRFIKENIRNIKDQKGYFYNNSITGFLICFPLILLGLTFYYYKYRSRLETDVTFAKASRAYKKAKKHLIEIEKHLTAKEIKNLPVLFEKMLTGYISDKFNIPLSNIVIEQIKKILADRNIDEKLVIEIENLYHEINICRYSQVGSSEKNFQELLDESARVINDIEKKAMV